MLYKTNLCKFYLKGTCKRGHKCSWAHGEKDIRPFPAFFKTRMCYNWIYFGTCDRQPCTYAHSHLELRGSGKALRLCNYYFRDAHCPKGARCPMAHDVNQLDPAIKNLPPLLTDWSDNSPCQGPPSGGGGSNAACSGALLRDANAVTQQPPSLQGCMPPAGLRRPSGYSLAAQLPNQQQPPPNPQELLRHNFTASPPPAPHARGPVYPQGPPPAGNHLGAGLPTQNGAPSPHHHTVQQLNAGLSLDERLPIAHGSHSGGGPPGGSPTFCPPTPAGPGADVYSPASSRHGGPFVCGGGLEVDNGSRNFGAPPVQLYPFGGNNGACTPASGRAGGVRPSPPRLLVGDGRHPKQAGGALDSSPSSLDPPPQPPAPQNAGAAHGSGSSRDLLPGRARAPGATFAPLRADPQTNAFTPSLEGVLRDPHGPRGSLLSDTWMWHQQPSGLPVSPPADDGSGAIEAATWSAPGPSSLLSGVGGDGAFSEPGTHRHGQHSLLYEFQQGEGSLSRRGSNSDSYPGGCDPFDHLWALLDDTPAPANSEGRGVSNGLNSRLLDLRSSARLICESGVDTAGDDVFWTGNALSELIGAEKREATEGFRDSCSTDCSQSMCHNHRVNLSNPGTDAASEDASPGSLPAVGVSGPKTNDGASRTPDGGGGAGCLATAGCLPGAGACGRAGGGAFCFPSSNSISAAASAPGGPAPGANTLVTSGRDAYLPQTRHVRRGSPAAVVQAAGFSLMPGGGAAPAASVGGEPGQSAQHVGKDSEDADDVACLCPPTLASGGRMWEDSCRTTTGGAGPEAGFRGHACCSPSNSNRSFNRNYSTSLGTSGGGSDVATSEVSQHGLRNCFDVVGGGAQGPSCGWSLGGRAGNDVVADLSTLEGG
ncbi:zinc finger (CCCH type) motif-containing protein [Besnoitia besnoiti]|uniref:Zinc finger (CCCH type) motif-containing protein n=1 Tax=Besnoitia besnoiti TaxID=94643 RepID=A0A2A9M3W6_BESBE|nr:zinc finger (CCCH type) motif-containing protein [Besnoitia besnoiti]PFH33178.1 zinc finger (CCCH type) motif-containing protein [Besnoitia besnoiti]